MMRAVFFLLLVLVSCSPLPAQVTTGDVLMTEKSATGKLVDKWIPKTAGKVIGWNGSGVLGPVDGGGGGGSGTVTSVALSLPGIFGVTGSPVTTSGTLAASLATQPANRIFAGPTTGSAAAPTFRALVAADIPDLSGSYQPLASNLTTLAMGFGAFSPGLVKWNGTTYEGVDGALQTLYGGTGIGFYTLGDLIYADGTTSLAKLAGNTSPTKKYLSQTGPGFGSAPPAWSTIAASELTGLGTGIATALAVNTGSAGAPVLFNGAGGTPSSITLTNGAGLPLSTGITGFGFGVSTALGINTGSAGAPVLYDGAGGTPTSITLTNGTNLPLSTGITGLGTGIATALAVNTGSAGAPVLYNGAGGTPSSITLTNATGLPLSTGITGLGTGVAAALAINTGSAGAPVLFNGAGGTPSSITLTNASGTASSLTAGVATVANGLKTATTTVVVSAATAPTSGQVLTATSSTAADWETPSGGGSTTGFTTSLATASPNNTINASMIAASGGTTNQDAVIAPKGTGALIGFGIPDNTATGGAKRGDYAVDFQGPFRNNSADIASGASSAVLGGRYNKATGSYALAFGYLSAATGSSAPIALGYQSSASANYSAAIGGIGNTASGSNALAIGGQSNTASGSYATATGYSALADRYGLQAKAAGAFAAAGDAQAVQFILRCKTTTNAAVQMFLDGASTRFTIPSGKGLYGIVKIIGMKSDGSVAATYTRQVAIKNVAGTTALIGTVNTLGTDETGSTSISITADDTNDALNISPTGITSETWRWVATFEGVEVAYGT